MKNKVKANRKNKKRSLAQIQEHEDESIEFYICLSQNQPDFKDLVEIVEKAYRNNQIEQINNDLVHMLFQGLGIEKFVDKDDLLAYDFKSIMANIYKKYQTINVKSIPLYFKSSQNKNFHPNLKFFIGRLANLQSFLKFTVKALLKVLFELQDIKIKEIRFGCVIAINFIFNCCMIKSQQGLEMELKQLVNDIIEIISMDFYMKRLNDSYTEIQIAIINNLIICERIVNCYFMENQPNLIDLMFRLLRSNLTDVIPSVLNMISCLQLKYNETWQIISQLEDQTNLDTLVYYSYFQQNTQIQVQAISILTEFLLNNKNQLQKEKYHCLEQKLIPTMLDQKEKISKVVCLYYYQKELKHYSDNKKLQIFMLAEQLSKVVAIHQSYYSFDYCKSSLLFQNVGQVFSIDGIQLFDDLDMIFDLVLSEFIVHDSDKQYISVQIQLVLLSLVIAIVKQKDSNIHQIHQESVLKMSEALLQKFKTNVNQSNDRSLNLIVGLLLQLDLELIESQQDIQKLQKILEIVQSIFYYTNDEVLIEQSIEFYEKMIQFNKQPINQLIQEQIQNIQTHTLNFLEKIQSQADKIQSNQLKQLKSHLLKLINILQKLDGIIEQQYTLQFAQNLKQIVDLIETEQHQFIILFINLVDLIHNVAFNKIVRELKEDHLLFEQIIQIRAYILHILQNYIEKQGMLNVGEDEKQALQIEIFEILMRFLSQIGHYRLQKIKIIGYSILDPTMNSILIENIYKLFKQLDKQRVQNDGARLQDVEQNDDSKQQNDDSKQQNDDSKQQNDSCKRQEDISKSQKQFDRILCSYLECCNEFHNLVYSEFSIKILKYLIKKDNFMLQKKSSIKNQLKDKLCQIVKLELNYHLQDRQVVFRMLSGILLTMFQKTDYEMQLKQFTKMIFNIYQLSPIIKLQKENQKNEVIIYFLADIVQIAIRKNSDVFRFLEIFIQKGLYEKEKLRKFQAYLQLETNKQEKNLSEQMKTSIEKFRRHIQKVTLMKIEQIEVQEESEEDEESDHGSKGIQEINQRMEDLSIKKVQIK